MNDCKHKISKKSFKNLCKDKLDFLKIQLCRNELEELIYDLGLCKDEKIDYIAIKSYLSPTTVKKTLKTIYTRTNNLPKELFNSIFST